MRGMMEDANNARVATYQRSIRDFNRQLAREKKQREDHWKADQERQNQLEVTLTDHHEVLQPDGKTLRTDNWM